MRGWWWWWWIIFVVWLTKERRLALFPTGTIARDPHHRKFLTRGEQDDIAYGKYWRMSSLIRNLLIVKYHAPYKAMYSKYQIIKILEKIFQKMNCFSWIKLTPILIHLKYWHYNFPYLELPCLPQYPCHILSWPTEIPLQYNPHHVLHWSPYFVLPNSTARYHNCWIN